MLGGRIVKYETVFVRIKKRWRAKRDVLLSAVLVESVRSDGRPRQRIVKHLASMRLRDLPLVFASAKQPFRDFERQVRDTLNQLNLPSGTQTRIEQQVRLKILRAAFKTRERLRELGIN
jgi:hypothetical protein